MGPAIVHYVTIFPLFLALWQDRPLTADDLHPGPYPVVISPEQIALQRQVITAADRELRLTMVKELRQSGEQAAFMVLLTRLGEEKDPGVLAAVLQQLEMSPFRPSGLAGVIAPLLERPEEPVRYWAVALYGRCDGADPARLVAALQDPIAAIRLVAAARLRDRPEDVTSALWQAALDGTDPAVAAALAAGFCRSRGGALAGAEVARVFPTAHAAVRQAIADSLADLAAGLQERLLPLAADDPGVAVRGAAATAMGRLARPKDQPRLLALTRDADPEVRRRAVAACRAYPDATTLVALIDRLLDERALVRREAEEAVVAIHETLAVGTATSARLATAAFPGRGHLCRVLGRVGHREAAPEIHGILQTEREPEGLRDAAMALGLLEYDPAAADLARLGDSHESPVVREAVAEALGRLARPESYDTLRKLAFAAEDPVRQAAILSMGRIGDGEAFNATILKVLNQVRAGMSGTNRAAAAWSAGRLRPIDPALVQRLRVQATVPVVPGEMGEMLFEEDPVMANVDMALAALAREDAGARTALEAVCLAHSPALADGSPASGPGGLVATAEVVECARQAQAHAQGQTPTPGPRPTVSMTFSVERYTPVEP